MRRHLSVLLVAVLAGACARNAAPAWSPIQDDADDATASLAAGWTLSPSATDRAMLMGDQADVTFVVTRPGAFDAILDATSFQKPRRVQVNVDGEPIAPPFLISAATAPPVVLPIGTLGFGSHHILFESLDGADTDAAGKRLSVALRRLTMERVGG